MNPTKKKDNMKKILAFAFTILTSASMICSCGGSQQGSKKGADSLTFDSIVVDTTASLTEKADSPCCEVKIAFTFAKGANADAINQAIVKSGILVPDYLSGMENNKDMQAVVDTFVNRLIADYINTFKPLYQADRDSRSLSTVYNVSGKITDGPDGVKVYTADVYQFAGGAHGSLQTIVNNIDIRKGRVLTLKDLFVPGGEMKMKELIVERMMRAERVKTFKELQNKGYFMDMEAYVPDNFILGDKEITFLYNADEIAPHALGPVHVTFTYSELEKIMKKI